jgi:alkylhydroperoxidase family enzyme
MLAKIEGGEYEWIQHVPIAISVGVTQAQAAVIARQSVGSPCFRDRERTVLRFTEQVVNRVRADETTVKELMKFLSPREVVKLIVAIGSYLMMARLTETTRTDLDPSAGTKIMDALHR